MTGRAFTEFDRAGGVVGSKWNVHLPRSADERRWGKENLKERVERRNCAKDYTEKAGLFCYSIYEYMYTHCIGAQK